MANEILYSPSGGNILYSPNSGYILYSDPSLTAPYKSWLGSSSGSNKYVAWYSVSNEWEDPDDKVDYTKSDVYPIVRNSPTGVSNPSAGSLSQAWWWKNVGTYGSQAYCEYSIYTRKFTLSRPAGHRITAIDIRTNPTYHKRPAGGGALMVTARVSNSSSNGDRSTREGGISKNLGTSYNGEWAVDLDASMSYLFINTFVAGGEPPTASGNSGNDGASSAIYNPSYVMITPN